MGLGIGVVVFVVGLILALFDLHGPGRGLMVTGALVAILAILLHVRRHASRAG